MSARGGLGSRGLSSVVVIIVVVTVVIIVVNRMKTNLRMFARGGLGSRGLSSVARKQERVSNEVVIIVVTRL